MKPFVSVIILTVAFLSAGAFANAKQAQPAKANITIVSNNQASPEKDQSRIDACAMARCIEV